MAVPGFTTVVGPIATDAANGATAYNGVVAQTEVNYPRFNTWAASAETAFPKASVVVKGSALFTPASGWAFEGLAYRECWAKKWGGVTYVSMAVKRTGAAIAAGTGGNLVDSTIGTFAAGYWPLDTYWLTAFCVPGGMYQLYVTTAGVAMFYSAAGVYGLPASRSIVWSMVFPNTDIKPF
jgi:hypothetical protein